MKQRWSDASRVLHAAWSIMTCNVLMFWKLRRIAKEHQGGSKTQGETEYIDRFTRCQTRYGSELFRRLSVDLGVTVTFDREGVDLSHFRDGLIIISNHTSTMDIPIVYNLLEHLDWTWTYWVMKQGLEGTPFGWAGRETHAAFVHRDRDPRDQEAIRRCAAAAHRDRAGVAIFVEGTRATKERLKKSPHKKLLPVHTTGFALACEEMPNADVLSITLEWDDGAEFRTIWNLGAFCGRRLVVHAKLVPRSEVGTDPRAWLKKEWFKKDDLLVNGKASRRET